MQKEYQQLKYEDRVLICSFWKQGATQTAIAKTIGVHRSTISRELKGLTVFDRNLDYRVLAKRLHEAAMNRKSEQRRQARITEPHIWQIVESKLRDELWSPELIALWLTENIPSYAISHQTIYNYIKDIHPELITFLKRKGKNRKCPGSGRKKQFIQSATSKKVSILERPNEINERIEPGHWEADTVGAAISSKSTILILLERVSRFVYLIKIPDRSSESVRSAIFNIFSQLPVELRRSITFDNGPENALHYTLKDDLGTSTFFCEPFHSWEKGSVENRIGVLRRWFPKGTNFDSISIPEVANVQWLLNHRPLKITNLNFPNDLFSEYLFSFSKKKAA